MRGPGRRSRTRFTMWCLGLGCAGVTLGVASDPPPITFAPSIPFLTGEETPWNLVAADFNGDGRRDLAITVDSGVAIRLGHPDLVGGEFQSSQVAIALGNGDGTFALGPGYASGMAPATVRAGDFYGDGWPDLMIGGLVFGMAIFLNLGDGIPGPRIDLQPARSCGPRCRARPARSR